MTKKTPLDLESGKRGNAEPATMKETGDGTKTITPLDTKGKNNELLDNPNIIWVGAAGFQADNDKIIVLQDDYRSGYECSECLDKNKRTTGGREVSTVVCPSCDGTKKRPKAGNPNLSVKCTECEGEGWVVCPTCDGKGGSIVIPEKDKGRPTTGTIVSIGPDVNKTRKRGDKVIYPSFAGHAYDLSAITKDGKTKELVLVILRDSEVLSRMYGTLEQNAVKRSAALHTVA